MLINRPEFKFIEKIERSLLWTYIYYNSENDNAGKTGYP
mgnify:CR=1 FL=1